MIWRTLRGLNKSCQRGICQPYVLTMQIATLASMQRGFDFSGQDHSRLFALPSALLAAAVGAGVFRKLSTAVFSLVVNWLLMA